MKVLIVNQETDYSYMHNYMLKSIPLVEKTDDLVIITQHKPVITLGRDSREDNIRFRPPHIPVIKVDRGGDVTLHSPGQLMIYPIIKLDRRKISIIDLIRVLEESVIEYIKTYGLEGYWIKGTAGVWTKGRKIASIGLGIKRWVSYHGMAFNICNDLSLFELINPCGLDPTIMTNLSREIGRKIEIDRKLIREYIDIFLTLLPSRKKEETEIIWTSLDRIHKIYVAQD